MKLDTILDIRLTFHLMDTATQLSAVSLLRREMKGGEHWEAAIWCLHTVLDEQESEFLSTYMRGRTD